MSFKYLMMMITLHWCADIERHWEFSGTGPDVTWIFCGLEDMHTCNVLWDPQKKEFCLSLSYFIYLWSNWIISREVFLYYYLQQNKYIQHLVLTWIIIHKIMRPSLTCMSTSILTIDIFCSRCCCFLSKVFPAKQLLLNGMRSCLTEHFEHFLSV